MSILDWFRKIKVVKCDHDFKAAGWSYLKCYKCEEVICDPEQNSKIRSEYILGMMRAGHATAADVVKVMLRGS